MFPFTGTGLTVKPPQTIFVLHVCALLQIDDIKLEELIYTIEFVQTIFNEKIYTVPLKSKLPPSRETRVSSLETSVSSRESLVSREFHRDLFTMPPH